MAIKWSTKGHDRAVNTGTGIRENHYASHLEKDPRPVTHYQPTSQSPCYTKPSPRHFHQKIKTTDSLPTHTTSSVVSCNDTLVYYNVQESIREYHFRPRPCFFLSILHVLLLWFVRWEVSVRTTAVCRMLLPRFVQDGTQHSCVIPIKLFLYPFFKRPCGSSI